MAGNMPSKPRASEVNDTEGNAADLVARLDRIAREESDIKQELARRLDRLLAEKAGIEQEIGRVDLLISTSLGRLRKVHAAAAKTPPAPRGDRGGGRYLQLPVKPAVPISKSILGTELVCLIDGVKRKMLHRHLKTKYGITPEEYRKHFGLPDDYPMTAPGYSSSQSKAVTSAIADGRVPGRSIRTEEKA